MPGGTCGLLGLPVQVTSWGDSEWLSMSFSFYLRAIQIPQTRILRGKTSQVPKGSWRSRQTFSHSPSWFNPSSSWCFQGHLLQRINLRSLASVEEANWAVIWLFFFCLFFVLHFKTNIKAFIDTPPKLVCEWSYYTGKSLSMYSFSFKSRATWSLVESGVMYRIRKCCAVWIWSYHRV